MALNNPYAHYYDGIDDATTITLQNSFINDPALTGQMTVEFWAIIQGGYYILSSGAQRNLYKGFHISYQDGDRIVALRDGSREWVIRGAKMPLNELHHYAMVWDGDVLKWLVDGVVANEAVGVPVHRSMTESLLCIGGPTSIAGYYGKFYMDELRIWNHARTQAQIQENMYKTLTGTEPGLELYYRFDTGSGNIAYDSSSNGYHGEIIGATWVPGLVDLVGLAPPGRVDISAVLGGSASMSVGKADRIRGLSAHLTGAATATGGTPIRIRGLSANLEGAGTINIRMNLIAALKAKMQGAAAFKSNILVLYIPEGVYVIDADEIFSKDQPSRGQVVANHIEVWVNPLKPADTPEEVYRSKDPVTIPAGQAQTVTIQFDDKPVTEPAVTLEEAGANLSIIETKYYAWGADVTIRNSGSTDQTCLIVAIGRPLEVTGREKVVREDPVSIQENGLKKYEFDNPFVQDRKTAEMIAERLLSYANARRDISIEWRGDPALELADIVMIPEYQRKGLDQRGIFYVTKQELEFDGGLRAKLEGRKM